MMPNGNKLKMIQLKFNSTQTYPFKEFLATELSSSEMVLVRTGLHLLYRKRLRPRLRCNTIGLYAA